MEQDSQYENDLTFIEAQIRESFGKVAYTNKVHEKCADIYFFRQCLIKNIQIILSAIITTSITITLFGKNYYTTAFSAIISLILLILNTYVKNYNLSELVQKHMDVANKLWKVREDYFSLLSDIATKNLPLEQLRQRRDNILVELTAIYKNIPRTLPEAYVKAKKALQVNEELTFCDAEIDMFLPNVLKKLK